jgi:ArsR family transcriptional regulator, virulence genes transcriptional regulator
MTRRPEEIAQAADVFKALAHPQRLQIACLLIDGGEQTQKQLIEATGLPQSTMARHLDQLRQAGLVQGRRQAQEVQLQVAGPVLSRMLDAMCDWFRQLREEPAMAAPASFRHSKERP